MDRQLFGQSDWTFGGFASFDGIVGVAGASTWTFTASGSVLSTLHVDGASLWSRTGSGVATVGVFPKNQYTLFVSNPELSLFVHNP